MGKSNSSPLLEARHLFMAARSVIPSLGHAQDFSKCAFNGKWEEYDSTRLRSSSAKSGVRARRLSDGKTVNYLRSNCTVSAGRTVHKFQVNIVEDNGRITHGDMVSSGRGTHIKSRLGNKTVIPPFE